MPNEVVIKRQFSILLKNLVVGITIAVALSIVIDVGAVLINLNYKNENAKQQSYINSKIGNEIQVNVLNVMQKKMEYKDKVLKAIDGTTIRVSDILRKIQEIIPKGIAISSLEADGSGKVAIGGTGSNEELILDFFHSLKKCDLIKVVDFTDIKGEIGSTKGLEFNFTFELNSIGSDSNGTK